MDNLVHVFGNWLDANSYYLACWFLITANSLILDVESIHWWAADPYRAGCLARAIFDLGFVKCQLDMRDWMNALNTDFWRLKSEIAWSLKLFNTRERQMNGLEP